MVNISIIIRCYNEEEHIGRLLSGIAQQTEKNVEIILVDSGSTDATLSIASRYHVNVVYISPEEFSFGRALNFGCRVASGEYLVFISAHCWPVYKNWLERLLAPFTDPKAALVYGSQRGNETTKFSEHQIFAKWFPEHSNFNQEHPFCNNANAAIRRKLWEKIPYDEKLTGLEDLDWAKRVMKEGYHIAYVSDAEIIHVHNETLVRIYNRYRREAIALKKTCPDEKFNPLDFLYLFASNVISDYYHAWHKGLFLKNLTSIPLFRLMQFSGTYRGFSQKSQITNALKHTFYYPKGLRVPGSTIKEKEKNQTNLIDYTKTGKEDFLDGNN